jgi:penicillin-binding protein 1A
VQDAGYTPATEIPSGPVMYGGVMRTFKGGGGSLASCLAWSKNTASVFITNLVGVKRVLEFAESCGIKSKLPPYTSVALGAAEIPMLEMLQAYSMFPNKSQNVEPVLVTRIEDKSGNLLQEFASVPKQVMSETSAYTMVQLMKGVIQFGTARSLNSYNIPVEKAGKTGTTNDNADGWFIGYTPELLAGTWVGCEDPFIRIYSGTAGGSEMAAPKWGIFMSKVYADKKLGYGKLKEFEKPSTMGNEELSADADWGKLFAQGDSTSVDEGNGNAGDFIDAPMTDEPVKENISIESNIPKAAADTNKQKKGPDGKEIKTASPALKPADDKMKKPVKADAPKTGGQKNDYLK